MIHFKQTTVEDNDFRELVALLDADLKVRDGDEHAFFAALNTLDTKTMVLLAYDGAVAVGSGAIREYREGVAEIKRMYVRPEYRGRGIATMLLDALCALAIEQGFLRVILETGVRQPEAIALYKKRGFHEIDNYGPYVGVAASVSFEKVFVGG